MSGSSLEKLLRRFGFSGKEIDTYLAILEQGEAKASIIADDANVSQRHVYSVAETLADRGFVEVNDHIVPTIIKANPPESVVETLADDLNEIEPALESRFSQAAPRSESFEVVKSRVTVIKRIAELLDRADVEATLAIPHRLLDEVTTELRDAVDRGALVILLVTEAGPEDDFTIDGLASVARTWEQPTPTILAVDREMGLVAPPEMLSQANSSNQAIVFAQEQLGAVIVGSFLGNYFPMATEIYAPDPEPLPVTYEDFRHAVLQATLHSRAGTTVHAHVTGRPLYGDDGPTELDGVVVDVRQPLLDPTSSSFPVENTLVIETDEGTYNTGGLGAFVEDFEATEVELRSN